MPETKTVLRTQSYAGVFRSRANLTPHPSTIHPLP
jgi:hypothetical protein